ncbi:MAG: hypothetical protein K0S01_165 [Herbinix sp.]|jgi:hypothetical protein|nr:hypothetical protein [Herbinix sp.]
MFQDRQSQKAVSRSFNYGIFQIMVGGFFSFIFGLTFFAQLNLLIRGTTSDVGSFFVLMVLAGLSVYLLLCGMRRLKLIRLYRNYIQLLSQAPSHSIDQLAYILKSPVQMVRFNLIQMIKKRYLAAAYIDTDSNRLVSSGYGQNTNAIPTPNFNRNPNNVVQPQKMNEIITVTCKNCGASNKVTKGIATECEYCGSNVS